MQPSPSSPAPGAPAGPELTQQLALLRGLEAAWHRQGCRFQRHETHISWIYVLDRLAYKFKKALRFDVLDYATLAARRHCCEEEVRLNRRLAPGLYLGVSAVTGGAEPTLDGDGPALEYAVRMRTFPQQALWSARLDAGSLQPDEIDALALLLARFHADAARAAPDAPWGGAGAVGELGRGDLATVDSLLTGRTNRARLARLARWHETQIADAQRFERRRADGHVRECHGDLHSGNILSWEGRVDVFDGIEFNDELRWTDVAADLAFIVMDLRFHGRDDLAARLLQGYLAASDDYAGLRLLAFYQARRALVRCKVLLMAAAEAGPREGAAARASAGRYLALAARTRPRRGALVLMHGYSGSGKSYCAARLAAALGAIHIRSDVERKRLHGLAPTAHMAAPGGQGIYAAAADRATYTRLLQLARAIGAAGLDVVVDAAHLHRWQRQPFQALARELGLAFVIVDLPADDALLRERLRQRALGPPDASDAGSAVLDYQYATAEPLTAAERRHVLTLDGAAADLPARIGTLAATVQARRRPAPARPVP